jgi:hypothetical protein
MRMPTLVILVGVLALGGCKGGESARSEVSAEREREAKAAAQASAEIARRQQEAEAEVARKKQEMAALQAKAEEQGDAIAEQIRNDAATLRSHLDAREWQEARQLATSMQERSVQYGRLDDLPAPLAVAFSETEDVMAAVERAFAVQNQSQQARDLLETGEAQVESGSYSDGNLTYKKAIETLKGIPATDRKYVDGYARLLKKAKGLEQKNRRRAERQLKEIEEAATRQARRAALEAKCGPKPKCGGWDGGCQGDETIFKSDVEVSNCSEPKLVPGKCWVVTCDVTYEKLGVYAGRYELSYQAFDGVPLPVTARLVE